jgi:hypothetical protein
VLAHGLNFSPKKGILIFSCLELFSETRLIIETMRQLSTVSEGQKLSGNGYLSH